MGIRIKLLGGDVLVVSVDAAAWNDAFKAALSEGGMVQVRNDGGRVLAINPHQVAYVEEVEPAPPEPQSARHLEPVAR